MLTGTVTAVHDGDTFTLKSGSSFYKIRLAEVDAPELGQTFGRQAREFTRHRVLGKRVRVNVALTDRYGRRIGEVIVEDGRVLNEELVHAGLAWYYRVNPVKNPRLQKLEREAFAHRLGLWLVDPPLPPWEFRRETVVPEPPANMSQVDYDRIFHYGIVGNRRTHIVRWPACQNYRRSKPRHALIFYSLQQARQMGFRFAKDCPQ
ncbi:MAG: hypothetical protein GWN10_15970 [Nitrospinaceae bacterium]|nr:hypothetical protein [Nitrospinaceae bacterium]NIW07130.1 hypothetical protein [Nitrospinaceae bacterium]NIX35715.1 hypothetical protein [Nitrospinaceae bacterium]